MMNSEQLYDVTIIGGGSAGLFSAFYSGLREMKTKIIEFQSYLGGKLHEYPEKMIWDVGGITPITGEGLIKQMVQQGQTFDPHVVLDQKVTSINKDENGNFVIQTSTNQKHLSKTVILAVGRGISKPLKLNIEDAERFESSNLHYTVKSLAHFKGKTVLISGGGDTAIDWANTLEPIAENVYLIYRGGILKGHEAEVSRLFNSSVECLLNTSIQKLIAANDHETIDKVELVNSKDGDKVQLSVDEVIISHGYEGDNELTSNSGLNIEMAGEYGIAGSPMSETSVTGLYAAGDILNHEGKLYLIAGAFQDAANAVNKAKQYINPEAYNRAMVSTHIDTLKEKSHALIKHLYTVKNQSTGRK